jgi:hypothetical protein
MLRRVALVRTDISEECSAFITMVTRICELGTLASCEEILCSRHSHGRRVDTVFLRSLRRLLVTANVVPSSPILVTLMMEALGSSETAVLTRTTQRNFP